MSNPNGDRFRWVAIYSDGTSLPQVNPDGSKNAYGAIDRSKLAVFELREGDVTKVAIALKPGQRLIWRRRTETNGFVQEVCHIIGKQETIDGKNVQGVIGIFESDGTMIAADRFDDAHPWFKMPQIHPNEGETWNT